MYDVTGNDVAGPKPWDDHRISFDEWPAIKAAGTKWGQIPSMMVDGEEMTQTRAVVRFLGAKVSVAGGEKMYPVASDDMTAFKCDELIEAMEDLRNKLVPTFAIKVGCCPEHPMIHPSYTHTTRLMHP